MYNPDKMILRSRLEGAVLGAEFVLATLILSSMGILPGVCGFFVTGLTATAIPLVNEYFPTK